mmetsp:Transcript_29587/g.70290  ORF Transcript_29587/g.70290 Transcript_29587/m.70290 type:complete len:243 (-) Transcript_29587:85-813(-)
MRPIPSALVATISPPRRVSVHHVTCRNSQPTWPRLSWLPTVEKYDPLSPLVQCRFSRCVCHLPALASPVRSRRRAVRQATGRAGERSRLPNPLPIRGDHEPSPVLTVGCPEVNPPSNCHSSVPASSPERSADAVRTQRVQPSLTLERDLRRGREVHHRPEAWQNDQRQRVVSPSSPRARSNARVDPLRAPRPPRGAAWGSDTNEPHTRRYDGPLGLSGRRRVRSAAPAIARREALSPPRAFL